MRTLEKISWPEQKPVDLLHEFQWIVGRVPPAHVSPTVKTLDQKIAVLKDTSPFTQLLSKSHRAKIVLVSPAKQAQQRIQRLAHRLELGSDVIPAKKYKPTPFTHPAVNLPLDWQDWKNEATSECNRDSYDPKSDQRVQVSEKAALLISNLNDHHENMSTTLTFERAISLTSRTTKEASGVQADKNDEALNRKKLFASQDEDEDEDTCEDDALEDPEWHEPYAQFKTPYCHVRKRSPSMAAAKPFARSSSSSSSSPSSRSAPSQVVHNAEEKMRIARWLKRRYRATSSSLFSSEMQARLTSTMSANTGKGLWRDEVSSRLACPMDADVVFGEGSDGKAPLLVIDEDEERMKKTKTTDDVNDNDRGANEPLREDELEECSNKQQPTGAISSAAAAEKNWIEQKAREIKAAAAKLVQDGSVPEALATLQKGVDVLIPHRRWNVPVESIEAIDENHENAVHRPKSRWGFNYTRESHVQATRMQHVYRRRYKRMNASAILLQRHWKGFFVRRKRRKLEWRQHASARCIQQWWHLCTVTKEAMRLRIQTAMRRKLAQKRVQAFREACKVVRHSIRKWVVSRVQCLRYQKSIVAATVLERHARGRLARKAVMRLRDQIEKDEVVRYRHEQDYLEHEMRSKLDTFATFLLTSGQAHVKALAKQLQAKQMTLDEERTLHLKLNANDMHRARVKDVFDSYDLDGSGAMDVYEIKGLFDELEIPIIAAELHDVIQEIDTNGSGLMEFDEFFAWLESPARAASQSKTSDFTKKSKLWFLHMQLKMKHLLGQYVSHTSFHNHARRILVHNERRRLSQTLRAKFRVSHAPRFACSVCHQSFCFYRSYWYHMRQECRRPMHGTAAAEITELQATDDEAHEEKRLADEENAVEVALRPLHDTVFAFLKTKGGQLVLAKEMLRVKALRKSRQGDHTKNAKNEAQEAVMSQESNLLLKDLFSSFDLDESNLIDRHEFSDLVQELGLPLTRAAIATVFEEIDIDQSGHVSYEEFETWVSNSSSSSSLSVTSYLQQWWSKLWNVKAKKQRLVKEATRYIVAKEKILMERHVRATFRATWPPKYTCSYCGHDNV